MPLYRQLPKRGFTNIRREEVQIINIRDLRLLDEGVEEVNSEVLAKRGLVHYPDRPVKLLGDGEATRAWKVDLTAVSDSARKKIEDAGGSVTVLEPAPKRGKYRKKSERLTGGKL